MSKGIGAPWTTVVCAAMAAVALTLVLPMVCVAQGRFFINATNESSVSVWGEGVDSTPPKPVPAGPDLTVKHESSWPLVIEPETAAALTGGGKIQVAVRNAISPQCGTGTLWATVYIENQNGAVLASTGIVVGMVTVTETDGQGHSGVPGGLMCGSTNLTGHSPVLRLEPEPPGVAYELTLTIGGAVSSLTITGEQSFALIPGVPFEYDVSYEGQAVTSGEGTPPVCEQIGVSGGGECCCASCLAGLGAGGLYLASATFVAGLGDVGERLTAGALMIHADEGPCPVSRTALRAIVPTDGRVIVERDDMGLITRVNTPNARVDVSEEPDSITLDFYDLDRGDTEPGVRWTVSNVGDANTVRAVKSVANGFGGREPEYDEQCTWSPNDRSWIMARGSGADVTKHVVLIDTNNPPYRIETTEVRSADDTVVSRIIRTNQLYRYGERTLSEAIQVAGGEWRVTTYEYPNLTNESDRTTFGKLAMTVRPDGSWTRHWYDGSERLTNTAASWLDVPPNEPDHARRTAYAYAPVDPCDTGAVEPSLPRLIVESIDGTVVSKTVHAYGITNGARIDIEERVASPANDLGTAEYGAPANLRTVTRYYDGVAESLAARGRVFAVEHPDGRMDAYAYAYGYFTLNPTDPGASTFVPDDAAAGSATGALWTVVTRGARGAAGAFEHVDGQTTWDVTVVDAYGSRTLMRETWADIAGGQDEQRIDWSVHTYDSRGRAAADYFADGTFTSNEWNSCCGKSADISRQGEQVGYEYDSVRRLAATIRYGTAGFASIVTSNRYDAAGRIVETWTVGGGLSQVTSNVYDMAGRLMASTDAQGGTTTYGEEPAARRSIVVRPDGGTEVREAYPDGSLRSVTGTAVVAKWYDYGVSSGGQRWILECTGPTLGESPVRRLTVTDPLGRTIREERPGFAGTVLTNTYAYDSEGRGRLLSVAQAGSVPTLYLYDAMGEQVASVLDLNANGVADSGDRVASNATRYVLEDGVCWRESSRYQGGEFEGKSRERLTGLTPETNSETESWDAEGRESVTRVAVDPAAQTVMTISQHRDSALEDVAYRILGLTTTTVSRTGVRSDYAYDGLRRMSGARDGRKGWSQMAYDERGRLAGQTDAAGWSTAYGYGAAGRRVSTRDALSNMLFAAYDAYGNPARTWGDSPYPVAYGYDAYGRMTNMTTYRQAAEWGGSEWPSGVSGDSTRWLHDEATGLLTNKVYADGKGVAYTYTPDGRIATRTWARGIVTTYGYDLAGQLTSISYSDDTPGVSFQYDAPGRLVVASNAAAWYGYGYEGASHRVGEETAGAPVVSVQLTRFYAAGRPAGISVDEHFAVTNCYDGLGRLAVIGVIVPAGIPVWSNEYLPASDLLAAVRLADGDAPAWRREYEAERDLIAVVSNWWDQTNSFFAYDNDGVGRRTRRVDSGRITNEFGYNTRSELVRAVMGTNAYDYAYDPIGNRVAATNNGAATRYAANQLNQYTELETSAVTGLWYDADGNLTNDGAFAYSWDAENQLVLAEPIDPATGAKRVRSAYDHVGRRIEKAVDVWDGSGWAALSTNRFVYDGWNLVMEVCPGSAGISPATNYFVWGLDLSGSLQGAGGIGGLLAQLRQSSGTQEVWLYGYDANGNVADVIDLATSIAVARYEYDPYGRVIANTGPAAASNHWRFSTKPFDPETGLGYWGFRYYSPTLGRWLSRDPIGEQGSSLYVFVGNAPIGRIDPKGLWGYDVHYGWTRAWAVDEGYQTDAAIAVAEADEGVDNRWETRPEYPGGQKYHFDRSGGGLMDTRLQLFMEHLTEAKKWCDWRSYGDVIGDVPDQAAFNLGTALHPRQDWVAHGDYGINDSFVGWHNFASLQWTYGPPQTYPDRLDLDAVGGPNGRPAGAAMMDDYAVANYAPGSQRRTLTESITRSALSAFLNHVRDRSKPCGECRRFFLGTN